jgi:hypothetical protein
VVAHLLILSVRHCVGWRSSVSRGCGRGVLLRCGLRRHSGYRPLGIWLWQGLLQPTVRGVVCRQAVCASGCCWRHTGLASIMCQRL